VAVVPSDRDAIPGHVDYGSKIGRAPIPANPVTDFELPGLLAGHVLAIMTRLFRRDGRRSVRPIAFGQRQSASDQDEQCSNENGAPLRAEQADIGSGDHHDAVHGGVDGALHTPDEA
jgi:hypothetical protein